MKMTKIQADAAVSALQGAFPGLSIDIKEPSGMGADNFFGISLKRRNIRVTAYDMFEAGDQAKRLAGVR